MTLSYDETHDGRPEWQVMREMEERVAVWYAKKVQARLLIERHITERQARQRAASQIRCRMWRAKMRLRKEQRAA